MQVRNTTGHANRSCFVYRNFSKYGGRRGLFRALHRQADAAALLVDIQNGNLDDIAD